MPIVSKTSEVKLQPLSPENLGKTASKGKILKLEPKFDHARELLNRGEYQLALGVLPAANSDLEVRNICAVCFIRLHRFAEAIDLLRTVALNAKINQVRTDVPDHIRVNFAIALFFGGQPAGGLEALREIDREQDPSVVMLREQARKWVASMSFFRRLDWRLNGVAPKVLPIPPNEPMGKCIWDLA